MTLFFGIVIALQSVNAPPAATSVEREFWVMGTRARLLIEGSAERHRLVRIAERVVRETERWDRLLSNWDPASQVSRLNALPVGPMETTAELADLLHEVVAWVPRTGGAFDPATGLLVELWGLQDGGRVPSPAELDDAMTGTGPGRIRVDVHARSVTRSVASTRVETGAFGKGAALRAVADLLRPEGLDRVVLDMGGQVLHVGSPGTAEVVDVAHPKYRDRAVARLSVRSGSVATSGTSERSFAVDGRRFGHILDPRTGRPAPAWGSVTVVTDDPLEADILSTALYVMGPEAGLRWIADHHPTLAALFLEDRPDGPVARWTGPMEAHLERLDDEIATQHSMPRGFDDE